MQGQSGYTRFKEERFAPVIAQSLRISKADSIARFAYYHVDLNSGGGYNMEVQVPGSPLNFFSAAARNDRQNFYAFFVDNDIDRVRELIRRPEVEARSTRVAIFHSDNAHVLPVVSEFVAAREPNPQYSLGSILIDPNGWHNGVPWLALREFCATHRRFDVFMNLNVLSFQRERSLIEAAKHDGWRKYQVQPISQFASWFSRPNWMLTDITSTGKGHRWVQLVGRTMQTNSRGYASLGYYDIRSQRGQSIIRAIEGDDDPEGTPQLSLLSDI